MLSIYFFFLFCVCVQKNRINPIRNKVTIYRVVPTMQSSFLLIFSWKGEQEYRQSVFKILVHPAQFDFFFTFFMRVCFTKKKHSFCCCCWKEEEGRGLGVGFGGGYGAFLIKTFPAFHLSTVYEQATTQQKPKGIQSTCTVGNACLWNIESGKNSLRNPKSFVLESEIKLKESKIPKDWSLEIKFHLQRLECNNWNLESKTVLDSLSCGNIQFCSIAVTSFWWNIFCSSFSRRLQAMQLKKSVGSLRMKIMQSR